MAQDEVQDYGYNTRDELISGQGLTYNYDDIGNRTTAEGKTYTANNLNQYTAIDTFEPQYDADGNQTLIKTSTGIWSVTYNAENRPVRWEQGDVVITMNFDRMGRRVFYKEEVNGEVTKHHRFVYDNYLCVQKLDALNNNSQINLFVWDPTESVATRPLFMVANPGNYKLFYTFDGNKNVSELVHFESRNGIAAHYDYAPFGAVTRAVNTSTISARDFYLENPFRFSSEYHEDTLGLVYYNYRHYNPIDGRWCGRDPIGERSSLLLYIMVENQPYYYTDALGEALSRTNCRSIIRLVKEQNKKIREMFHLISNARQENGAPCRVPGFICECCPNADGKRDSSLFRPSDKKIRLCYNNARNATALIETIAHELVHALDDCNGISWGSCNERACSEIRAMDIAGSCRLGGKHRKRGESYKACIRRNAAHSTAGGKGCGDGTGAVNAVFERCFNQGK